MKIHSALIIGSGHLADRVKKLLEKKGIAYTEIRVDTDPVQREEMVKKSNRHTVPQIFINDTHIGGFDDLYALERAGKLYSQ